MTARARAVIDLDVPGDVISRHLYGHFAEHLGRCVYGGFWVGEDSSTANIGGIRRDVVDALRAVDIPNLRWPGGCFADEYHWRDGIGPREQRPKVVNSHWGDVIETNHFGTHEFMQLCELLGADAYVNGNLGSGTVQEMSEWVEYLTRGDDSPMARLRRQNGRDEPWRVPFWGLGNEAWGCGGNMTPRHYADEARRYATFCRDHGGNVLTRIAAGAADDDLRWTRTLMESIVCDGCGPLPSSVFQAISFHFYTHSGEGIGRESATDFDAEQFYRTMAHASEIERILRAHIAVMDSYDPQRRIGLVCDEWGTWWEVEPGTNPGFLQQQNTLRDALVAGIHFDAFHRHAGRLRMANIAQTLNVLQAMILTDDDGGLILTPTYHVFEMNKGHHDARALTTHLLEGPTHEVAGTDLPLVSLSASTMNGSVLISLSHLAFEDDVQIDLDLRGFDATVRRARILTADDAHAHNSTDSPDLVAPAELLTDKRGSVLSVLLPPHAFATIELEIGV